MTPPTLPLPESAEAVCFAAILLIPCALAGLALINAGLVRSRAAAHSLLTALCVAGTAAIVWSAVGAAWEGFIGRPHLAFVLAGRSWDWLGTERWFLRGVEFDGSAYSLAVAFGLFAVALTALIPVGAAGERWRLSASCTSTVFLAGIAFPLFAHWAWSGWLAQLGVTFGLGQGFVDSGGAGAIQVLGGLSAFAVSRVLGPRLGKYGAEGIPAATPAHNTAFVLFGCFLAWQGFIGLDCAGSILFSRVDIGRLVGVPVNVTLAAACALLAAVGITRARFGKSDASLSANAWVAGLAASSAGCAVMRPAGAAFTGLIAGALVVFSIEWLEVYFKLDDPGGAVSVHALGGIWGLLAAGLFGETGPYQLLAQIVGVAVLAGVFLPLTYGANSLLDRVVRYRVEPAGERQGVDIYELGASAYPEFMTHTDEF